MRKTIVLNIPTSAEERIALADSRKLPKCWGVGRMEDNEKAVLLTFNDRLTDDQLRGLHEILSKHQRPYV